MNNKLVYAFGFLALLMASQQAQAACATAPVLPAVFVSPTGKDTGSGSETSPFLTIAKAISTLKSSTVRRIYIRQGTYKLSSYLTISNELNGLLIASYPCERATLDGGVDLPVWQKVSDKIYSVVVPNAVSYKDFAAYGKRQLIAGSRSMDPANPVAGWLLMSTGNILDADGNIRLDAFRFRTNQLNPVELPILTGLAVKTHSWGHQYDSWNAIKSIDWKNLIVYLYGEMRDKPESGTYRIVNNYRWLRKSGEFAWEWGSQKTLYTRQDNSDFQKTAVMPRLDSLLRIVGANKVQILNLNFRNVLSDGVAVDVQNSTEIKIGGNDFQMVGTGIQLQNVNDSLIAGNTMSNLGGSGIDLYLGARNKFYVNRIKNIGQVNEASAGLSLAGASDNWIVNNDISDSARYGISHKDWSKETINWRNHIEYNWVYDTCKATGDCGAIESLGRQLNDTGVTIRGNIVEKYNGLGGSPLAVGFKGFGIYLDDKSSGMLVEGNFIKNTGPAWAAVFVHGGDNNIIRYNHALADTSSNKFMRVEHVFDYNDANGKPIYRKPVNTTFTQNVVSYSVYTEKYAAMGPAGTLAVDKNLLVNTTRFNESGLALDVHSIVTNTSPYLDEANRNFGYRANSGAETLGIPAINLSLSGAGAYKVTTTYPRFW